MASRVSASATLLSTAARAGSKAGHGRKTSRNLEIKPSRLISRGRDPNVEASPTLGAEADLELPVEDHVLEENAAAEGASKSGQDGAR